MLYSTGTRPVIKNNLWSVLRWPIKDRGQSASSNQLSRCTRSPALRYSINLAGRQRKINCRESSGCPIVRAGPGSVISANMVEAFCATWKLVDSKNFDDYMKALGEHVNFFFSALNYNFIFFWGGGGCNRLHISAYLIFLLINKVTS